MLLKFKAFCTLSSHFTDLLLLVIMLAYTLYTVLAGVVVVPLLLYFKNPYFFSDLRYAITLVQIGRKVSKFKKQKPLYSILDCFLDKVARQPQKNFVLFEDSSYTYSQADKESSRVARALAKHADLKEGDTVALFLGNEPQFLWVWLALAKLGCTAALLNYNIRSKSLLHCFSCCDAKVLVAGAGKPTQSDRQTSCFLHYLCLLSMSMSSYGVGIVYQTALCDQVIKMVSQTEA